MGKRRFSMKFWGFLLFGRTGSCFNSSKWRFFRTKHPTPLSKMRMLQFFLQHPHLRTHYSAAYISRYLFAETDQEKSSFIALARRVSHASASP